MNTFSNKSYVFEDAVKAGKIDAPLIKPLRTINNNSCGLRSYMCCSGHTPEHIPESGFKFNQNVIFIGTMASTLLAYQYFVLSSYKVKNDLKPLKVRLYHLGSSNFRLIISRHLTLKEKKDSSVYINDFAYQLSQFANFYP